MFLVTYVPQAAVLSLVNGPLAIATTILLVLSESSTITNILARTFFIEDALLDTFDGVGISLTQRKIQMLKTGIDIGLKEHDQHRFRRTNN
jgi:hypothetical protein